MSSATLIALADVIPTAGGATVGHDDWLLTWRLATATTMWGTAQWGTSQWTDGWVWHDLTPNVIGSSWERGMPHPADRPRAGTATIELRLDADGALAPWMHRTYPYLDEGAIIQIVAWKPDGFTIIHQFTGTVETIEEVPTPQDSWRHVRLTLVEPAFKDLALIDGLAGTTATGAGETAEDRIGRLVAEADYRLDQAYWTGMTPVDPPPTMQATDLSQNRLADIFRTADSADLHFYQARNGGWDLRAKPATNLLSTELVEFGVGPMFAEHIDTIPWGLGFFTRLTPYKAPPGVARYDEADQSATWQRIGGTPQTVTGGHGRSGRHHSGRTDLICETDTSVAQLAQRHLDRGAAISHVATIEADAFMDPFLYAVAIVIDLFAAVPVWRELAQHPSADDVVMRGYVTRIKHNVGVHTTDQLAWTSTYTIAVTSTEPGPPTSI